jgi:hypothetical protein
VRTAAWGHGPALLPMVLRDKQDENIQIAALHDGSERPLWGPV